MNKTTLSLCLASLISLPWLAQAKPITLATQLKDYGGEGAYLAIYVTNAQGQYQKTLWVAGKKAKYYKELRDWARGSGLKKAEFDGVSGASVGFAVLLLLIGLGLHTMLERLPVLLVFIRFTGAAFFLYMAWQLAADDGVLSPEAEDRRPGFWAGAVMQWLNPKAWLASLASMGLFATEGGVARI